MQPSKLNAMIAAAYCTNRMFEKAEAVFNEGIQSGCVALTFKLWSSLQPVNLELVEYLRMALKHTDILQRHQMLKYLNDEWIRKSGKYLKIKLSTKNVYS